MEKRPWVTEATLEMTAWAEAFSDQWGDLVFGRYDHHDTLDYAYELYPTKGHLSPWRVARDEFDAMKGKEEYLPGGKYWRVLEPDNGSN